MIWVYLSAYIMVGAMGADNLWAFVFSLTALLTASYRELSS